MHIASQAGHPETTLVFLKKGVPLHMPNKVKRALTLLKEETQWHINFLEFYVVARWDLMIN